MSKRAVREVRRVTRVAGGSTLTKEGRSYGLNKVFRVLQTPEVNVQVGSLSQLKAKHVKRYVDCLLESGSTDRSVQNQLSHIRQAMRAANRGHYADSELMSTEAMGVAGASREGTHRPLTELQYRAARAAMRAANPGAACCMALQRELGLRAREAIQSISSLQVWANALKKRMSSEIVHGTKGGRKRHLAELHRDRALEVVETAILVAQAQGGKLIVTRSRRANTDGKKELKTAARAYCRACAKVGLKGEYSSHSIRCTYARERYERYMATHGDRREALASVSMDLGHGDGRGTYVAQVYLALPPRESPLL